MDSIYEKLQNRLDDMATGFPKTESKIEIRILEKLFDAQTKIAVLNCICRTWGRLVGNDCGKPLESCFYFGSYADYFVENEMGRYVDAKEAKKIIKDTLAQTGLVLQLGAGRKPGAVCICCGD